MKKHACCGESVSVMSSATSVTANRWTAPSSNFTTTVTEPVGVWFAT